MQNLLNRTLGKYEIVKEAGKGSMGTVYLAHDPFAGTDVAIKVAHPESLADAEDGRRYRKMFFNEAKVAGRLKHPNIVSVHDAGVEDDICYIVMEYVSGGRTLQEHCKPGTLLPIEDVVWMIFKCAKALDYAHRNGVVHRDIKPRNILLTQEMEVKIGDFSIALATRNDATETHVLGYVGSPLYMSPEQVMEEDITNQTDIFAIGVVMYEMLAGKHPFAADNLPAIIHQITEVAHVPVGELRSDVPSVLGHIVDRTLKKDPSVRYKSGLDLAADLSLVFDSIKLSDEDLSGTEKFKLARELSFFRDFSEPETWEVINACVWQEFQPGAEIIHEGEMDNAFYVIVSGDALVQKRGRKVDLLHRGDCFGEMGFIAKRERSATIMADTTMTVMKVRASLIERASLSCQLRFHKVFLNTLVERLSITTDQVTRSQPGPVPEIPC
jgi:eukaryotic-like serine/threonine-protein kinase